jgi:peptidoglycan/xylan/chitin deacetylase (PgdA/CDA1 family)
MSRLPAFLILASAVWIGLSPLPAAAAGPPGIPVLIYHDLVTDTTSPGETVIRLERFRQQMRWLHEQQFVALTLDQFGAILRRERSVPPRAVLITIDDGWRSGLQALPILRTYGLHASFWIIAGPRGIGDPYLTWDEVEAIDRDTLFEVASHTMSHPCDPKSNLVTWMDGIPAGHSPKDVRGELAESRHLLEEHLKRPVTQLAWPCGWYTDAMVDLAREVGYTMIMTAEDKAPARPGTDPLRVPRVFVDGACDLDAFAAEIHDARYHVCQTLGLVTRGHLPPGDARSDSASSR